MKCIKRTDSSKNVLACSEVRDRQIKNLKNRRFFSKVGIIKLFQVIFQMWLFKTHALFSN